jgi:hypothetical protein
MLAPVTTEPATGAGEVPCGTPFAAGVVVVALLAGDDGLVLEHPAKAIVITINIIARILIREIFIISLPV